MVRLEKDLTMRLTTKSVLILEPCAFLGYSSGGGFVQAYYYEKFLKTKDCQVSIFRGRTQESFVSRIQRLFKETRENNLLISFGAPFFGWLFAWFCWFSKKRGIFCLGAGFETKSVVRENICQSPLFIIRFALSDLVKQVLVSYCFFPKGNLRVLAFSEYQKKHSGKQFAKLIEGVIYPVVPVSLDSKEDNKKVRKKTILFCGHLAIDRGIIALTKACQKLWDRGYKFRLLILGYPTSELGRKELFQILRKADDVKVGGKVNNLRRYTQKAAMVVLPFRYPASFQPPLTLLEAMGDGAPVIATAVGANPDWLIDKKTGLTCKVKNPEDVASKIQLLLDNPKLGILLAKNAKDYLRKRYAEDNLLVKLAEESYA